MEFAFKISGNGHWGQWSKEHFLHEVGSWGLDKNKDLLINTMKLMNEKISKQLEREVKNFNHRFKGVKAAGRIKAEILNRAESFRKRNIL
ncbi:MAG: hypothetical protein PHY93_16185 [Bacteriovorax sp.]|nr:hypothetical protein [Bacteriovorax sp.]